MEKKKIIIFSISILILATLLLVSLTYAYYRTRIVGNQNETSISAISKLLKIEYSDGTALLNGNEFSGEYDEFVPGDIVTKSFSVENTGDEAVSYKVVLENVINKFTRTEDLKMTLTCTSSIGSCNGLEGTDIYYPIENSEIVENNIESKEIQTYILTVEYIYLPVENQSVDMGINLEGKVNIIDTSSFSVSGTLLNAKDGDYVIVESDPKRSEILNGTFKVIGLTPGEHKITLYDKNDVELASSLFNIAEKSKEIKINRENLTFKINNSGDEILLINAIKRDNVVEQPKTIPGQQLSSEDEAVLASTEDDYGTSYYYRGAVTNNYVKFGQWNQNLYYGYDSTIRYHKTYNSLTECQNDQYYKYNCTLISNTGKDMYWRIIRVNGDGSLRIIYDGTQAYANGTNNIERNALSSISFNSNFDDNKYVGYMYGNTSNSQATTHANINNSTIKEQIDSWYKTNIVDNNYGDAVADIQFCNDRTTPGKTATGWSYDTGLGYGTNATAYGAFARMLKDSSNSTPQFKCPNKTRDGFTVEDTANGNGALIYPVGLITVDEMVTAGGGEIYNSNMSYYLYKGHWYWSLSPCNVNTDGYASVFVNDANFLSDFSVSSHAAAAPVINLSPEYVATLIGTGTSTDPYRAPGVSA